MKYILTKTNNEVLGPYTSIQQVTDGYICDDIILQTSVTGPVVESEVADDYQNPEEYKVYVENFNKKQTEYRANSYPVFSDPIFFKWQRGEATQQEWLDEVARIQAQFPYIE